MAGILKKLFDGEINPDGRNVSQSAGYWENMEKKAETERILCATFSENQKELFEKYQALEYKSGDIDREERFSYGFRLGMLLAMEACEISDKYIE